VQEVCEAKIDGALKLHAVQLLNIVTSRVVVFRDDNVSELDRETPPIGNMALVWDPLVKWGKNSTTVGKAEILDLSCQKILDPLTLSQQSSEIVGRYSPPMTLGPGWILRSGIGLICGDSQTRPRNLHRGNWLNEYYQRGTGDEEIGVVNFL
jgi:hypothetical protein